ncbi:winged helix-turn-helix domain-containing protein [candidate division KSB1 bacterium]|nr:winged helix-turn-helix domain-containing protein [candidate division KSB1 bacterium]
MKNEIGVLAGNVWELLNKKGPMTLTQLKKLVNSNDFTLHAAIGWLAREDKLDFQKSGNSIKINLK